MKHGQRQEAEHKWQQYREGELELILSLPPTRQNVSNLANSLGRTRKAIEVVYRIAYRPEEPFARYAKVQRRKIEAAKKYLGFITAISRVTRTQS